jgi:hypothetical protein
MGVLSEREMDRLFDRLGDRLDAGEPRRQDEPEVECLCLADERGTAYRWAGGGSSGGAKRGEGELGRTDFVRRVPEHLRRLLIEIEGQTLAVPL